MSPLRNYRCEAGHEFEIYESMDGPKQTRCPRTAVGDDDSSVCGKPVERLIALPQRAIVKGGTRNHHGMRGVT